MAAMFVIAVMAFGIFRESLMDDSDDWPGPCEIFRLPP